MADKKAFVLPSAVALVDNTVQVIGTNSETGNTYTSHYELTKKGIKNRKEIGKYLCPSTFFGKGGIKETLVNTECLQPLSQEAIQASEKQEKSFKLLKALAD